MSQFKAKARAVELLGSGQIADYMTAISELWKNAYDAYARRVQLDLYRESYPGATKPTLCLWDDGVGMSHSDLESLWLVVGTDSKREGQSLYNEPCPPGMTPRVKMGEKGIGRLSVSMLGDQMLLLSKRSDHKLACMFMNWRVLGNHRLLLEDILVPTAEIDSTADICNTVARLVADFAENLDRGDWGTHAGLRKEVRAQLCSFALNPELIDSWPVCQDTGKTGTLFYIENLLPQLAEMSLSDASDEVRKAELNRLQDSLLGFSNPFVDRPSELQFKTGFSIYTEAGPCDLLGTAPFFSTEDLEMGDHLIQGNFDEHGRFSGMVRVFNQKRKHSFVSARRPRDKPTRCGPFTIRVAQLEGNQSSSLLAPDRWSDLYHRLDKHGGLYVYRDGLRLLPYGRPDYDFLEFEERRSRGAGYYFFSYRRMIGYVSISRADNGGLIEKAGREGFIANVAYREFRDILKEFFVDLAAKYFATKDPTLRAKQLPGIQARKNKALAAEKELEKRIRKEFRKNLRQRHTELLRESGVITALADELRLRCSEPTPCDLATVRAFADRAQELKAGLAEALIDRPARVSLTRFMEEKYREYEADYEEALAVLSEAEKMVGQILEKHDVGSQRTELEEYLASLDDQLEERLRFWRTEILQAFEERGTDFQSGLAEWRSQFERLAESTRNELSDLVSASAEHMAELRQRASRGYDEMYAEYDRRYMAYLQHIHSMCPEMEDDFVVGWHKGQYEAIQERLQTYSELAQLGLAIEIIDHEFHALYHQIRSSLARLEQSPPGSAAWTRAFSTLKFGFEHLEGKHQLLVPIYRTTRRTMTTMTGHDIAEFVRAFFRESIKAGEFRLETTRDLERLELVEFESIINPVFINLVENARYWLRSEGERIVRFDLADGMIIVSDSGRGIHDDDLERIFEPFYTTKPNGRGLGLHLCRINLEPRGYRIFATNDPKYNKLKGATFCIRLPAREVEVP